MIHVLRTQRNMRIHFAIAAAVLIAALVARRGAGSSSIALLLAIAFVLIAEMINTGARGADRRRDDLVRPASRSSPKDIAAGAVLIATVERRRRRLPRLPDAFAEPELAADRAAPRRAGRVDA